MADLTNRLFIAQAIIKPDANNYLNIQVSDTSSNTIFNSFSPTDQWIIGSANTSDAVQYNIYQLGVQTMPGVRFSFNSNDTAITSSDYKGVMVGQTGIFELDLREVTPVNQITFENLSGQLAPFGDMAYLYLDVVYGIIGITNVIQDDSSDDKDDEIIEGEGGDQQK